MLKIVSIGNGELLVSEHVFLKVEANCDADDYLLTDSTYGSDEAPTTMLGHVFFFPPCLVKKGDYVMVWTRSGTPYLSRTTWDARQHNLFWGLDKTVWSVEGDQAFLFHAPRAKRTTATTPKRKQPAVETLDWRT